VVVLRGPAASGKSTVREALAGRRPWNWATAAIDLVREDLQVPSGLDDAAEYGLLVQEVGIRTALSLRDGRNVVVDSDFQDKSHAELFLRMIDRPWGDSRVLWIRLTVETGTAITRARARRVVPLSEDRVRELHTWWNPKGIEGEVVVDSEGRTSDDVLADVENAIVVVWGPGT
jgi:predicted kinase